MCARTRLTFHGPPLQQLESVFSETLFVCRGTLLCYLQEHFCCLLQTGNIVQESSRRHRPTKGRPQPLPLHTITGGRGGGMESACVATPTTHPARGIIVRTYGLLKGTAWEQHLMDTQHTHSHSSKDPTSNTLLCGLCQQTKGGTSGRVPPLTPVHRLNPPRV